MISTFPCCHTPTQEYVVPRSIPIAGDFGAISLSLMNNSYCQYCTRTDISLISLSVVYQLNYTLVSRCITLTTVYRFELRASTLASQYILYHVGFLEGASSLAKHREILPLVGFLEGRHGNSEASRNSWKRYRCLFLSLDSRPWCYWLVTLRNDKKARETP